MTQSVLDAASTTMRAGVVAPAPDARPDRLVSRDPAAFPAVTGREEAWRFTPLARLRGLHDGTAVVGGEISVGWDAAPEVTVEQVPPDDPRVGSVLVPTERVTAQALAGSTHATVVTVPRGVVTSRPTVVTVRGHGGTGYGHLVVDVADGAEAIVVLDHGGSATYAANVEMRVGQAASLTMVSLQDWADDAVHVGAHVARLDRDARLRSVVVTLGGDLVRLSPSVSFAGPGADAELLGLFFADAGQHLEHRLFIDHDAPHCRSRVSYKGALQGADAHSVWVGDVLIRAGAVGTDTYELNRNLVLTDGARADSVPNLEIETGEVTGAGHASATGRFDDEQLFYLMSRGISAEEARRLVVRGFFADIVARVAVPELRDRLTAAIDTELSQTMADAPFQEVRG